VGAVERALAALAGTALLVVLVEAPVSLNPVASVIAAAVEVAVLLAGGHWVGGRPVGVRAAYVALALLGAWAVVNTGSMAVGATLLLLVVVAQAVLFLPLPAAVAVAAIAPLVHIGMGWGDGLRTIVGTLGAAAFTAVVTQLLRREQRARAELAAAHEQLRGYAAQAEELATSRERNRLARDIHDGLGHHLTVVQVQVQAARALLPGDPERADGILAQAQQQATDALAEVRRSVSALRSPRATPPLDVALEVLTAEACAGGVPTSLEVRGAVRRLRPDAEESLFRAAQEGLTNVRKHAGATAARVVLDYGDDAGAEQVVLEVCDDGRGVPAGVPAAGGGFGLVGLRERAERLGGSLTLGPGAGGGTALRVAVPA
jgi:signal transduction histidine kinase